MFKHFCFEKIAISDYDLYIAALVLSIALSFSPLVLDSSSRSNKIIHMLSITIDVFI